MSFLNLKWIRKNSCFFRVFDFESDAGAGGSTLLGEGIVYLSPKFVEELKVEFKASHKFSIAHELGHLHYDDNFKGKAEKEKAAQLAGLGAYSVVVLASLLTPIGLMNNRNTSLGMHRCKMRRALYSLENTGATRTPSRPLCCTTITEIASGGIDAVRQLQQHNIEVKQRWLSAPDSFKSPYSSKTTWLLIF